MIAKVTGPGHQISTYEISDREMAAGSTLGGPKTTIWIKATGALEKMWSSDIGCELFGSMVLHHWDAHTGIPLTPLPGQFIIHPDHQEHVFELVNEVSVHEDIFVLSGSPEGPELHHVDPAAAYYAVDLANDGDTERTVDTYVSIDLRGSVEGTVAARYDGRLRAFVVTDENNADLVRYACCSVTPTSHEVTLDAAKTHASAFPGKLSGDELSTPANPIGIFHIQNVIRPGKTARFVITLTFTTGGAAAGERLVPALPNACDALARTRAYYDEVLDRAVVMTPDAEVNRGVLWAKANMLRIELLTPQGWAFTNDPTRSNNSVARDTAWFAFGSDYITPHFSRESLLWYADHLEPKGMVVEYFDVRNGKTADYGLNVNDNTPLLILALWHHYNTTGDRDFLQSVYPKALKAAQFLLTQRNGQGLVWCTSEGTSDWGIIGWRNVIQGYRLSGATTEVNSECYAALKTIASMAKELGRQDDEDSFAGHARDLRAAINEHLLDKKRGLYYLNIDIDGNRRTDVTCDLVFPLMFGVADDETAANIVARLSVPEFWTDAGLHTVPRTSIKYGPTHGYGLLGGVWVGATFWYAFAAARFNPEFMGFALSTSFRHYSRDPRRNNTVPGQFSEWLHGETLVNQGMMLSPWFPPRYLWAAIEGAAGLDMAANPPSLNPHLARDWKWLGVRNLTLRGKKISWFAVEMESLTLYVNDRFESSDAENEFERDVSACATVSGDEAVLIALARGDKAVAFIGNTFDRTIITALHLRDIGLPKECRMRVYNSMRGKWTDERDIETARFEAGVPVEIDRRGFCVIELAWSQR